MPNSTTHNQPPHLSASMEDYLEAVYLLSSHGRSARVSDISTHLEVKKPSAHAALKSLKTLGYLTHKHYGPITLTAKGRAAGAKIAQSHTMLKQFFHILLGLPEKESEINACAVEHAITRKAARKIAGLMNFIKLSKQAELRKELGKFLKKQ